MRRRARQHIEDRAAAQDEDADPGTILRLLNEALATELMCVSRYQRHCLLADGADAESVKGEFIRHAREEQGHADQIAERIVQLGGAPNLAAASQPEEPPEEYLEGESLVDLLEEDLIAERIAMQSYEEILQYLGTKDAKTRQLLEDILAVEQMQAEALASLRGTMLRETRLTVSAA
jgi:bacterioferritin